MGTRGKQEGKRTSNNNTANSPRQHQTQPNKRIIPPDLAHDALPRPKPHEHDGRRARVDRNDRPQRVPAYVIRREVDCAER